MKPKFYFGWARLEYDKNNNPAVHPVGSTKIPVGFVFYYDLGDDNISRRSTRGFETYRVEPQKFKNALSFECLDHYLSKQCTLHQVNFSSERGSYQFLFLR